MKTIETKVYEFDELSDKDKETARDWLRECQQSDEWWESTYEDAERAHLKITSFDLGGAHSIEGQFMYCAESTAKSITQGETAHGKDCETFKTATKFLADLESARAKDTEDMREADRREMYDELESEFLKSILEDYRIILQAEYDYVNSDEQIEESILANEYTFTESGERFG